MTDLQADILEWHLAKYPDASLERIGLKLAEETGEACRAIDRIIHTTDITEREKWWSNLHDEIADIAIVLLVLCSRQAFIDFEVNLDLRADEVMKR